LLLQLMAEMKYIRERVDTLPTGPVQVSEMAYFRALVRKHVAPQVCPLPPESPSLSQPKFMLFSA
jgi:hypothetical protein